MTNERPTGQGDASGFRPGDGFGPRSADPSDPAPGPGDDGHGRHGGYGAETPGHPGTHPSPDYGPPAGDPPAGGGYGAAYGAPGGQGPGVYGGQAPDAGYEAGAGAYGGQAPGSGYETGDGRYGGQVPGAYGAEGHGQHAGPGYGTGDGAYGAQAPASGYEQPAGGPYGGQVPGPYAAEGNGSGYGTGGGAIPGPYGAEGHGQDAGYGYGGNGGGAPHGGQAPGAYQAEGPGSGYAVPGGGYAGGGHDGQDFPAGGRTYVPEPLAGPMPPYAEPEAPYGAPAAGDSWAGHAPAADGPAAGWAAGRHAAAGASGGWEHGVGQPHPQAYGETERTAVLPVVESVPQQTPGRRPDTPPAGERTGQPPVRTGSPIIAPGIQPAALTAALGLLMAGGAALGKPGLAVVLVVLQAVTAAGWFRLNGMWPARQGIALAFLSGVTADIGLLIAGGKHGPEVLVGTLGVWLLFVLVLQLRHHGSADERMSSLTATSASTLLTVLAAGYLATATSDAGSDPVVVGAIAVALAAVVRALPLPGAASVVVAVLAAAATGFATGPATGMSGGDAVLLAAACGVCALIGLRVASYDFPSRFVHFTAGVALPLTIAAPAVYVLGRALTG
jgi:hypothetical protein